ncbi:Aconitase A/isopropylmalate dehydratase small subunit [Cinnamomum micranthum f. kanehirae]|uniref:3-isopropylmalate dehydratase n=1 Tax=Cinnamomum micranthum f. kanehirae TaxID=337451 RepID=A0A443PG82_9MAGN|nr:Aconitase A/isopropylmalate dehydratase small subunit [Cinnamomum micranthum f. kanehirae]
MATGAAAATIPTFLSSSHPSPLSKLLPFSKSPTFKPLFSSSSSSSSSFLSLSFSSSSSSSSSSLPSLIARANTTPPSTTTTTTTFHGLCYVLGDNIDTDQIIPAEHLTLVPSKPDEYRKLGSLAFCGLPSAEYPIPFVDPSQFQSRYTIIVAGENFGCGSSREHAPVALGASGVSAIVAESYARIFFRNSVATGEVYPVESEGRICEECSTGDVVTVELEENRLINHTTGKVYRLKPIGDAGPVIQAGGIFAYARKTGMIASTAP